MSGIFQDIILWLLGGGGLVSILSMKSVVRKTKAEMEASIISNYETLQNRYDKKVEEQDAKIEQQNKKIAFLEGANQNLHEVVMSFYYCKIIQQHEEYRCPVEVAFHQEKIEKENDSE